jgi:hypothetical protein
MKKIPAFIIVLIMLLGLFVVNPVEDAEALGTSQYHFQTIQTYMDGEGAGQRSLNLTTLSQSEEQTVDCPTEGNDQWRTAEVGTWESEPMKKITRVRPGSPFYFTIWARGDVAEVMFSIDLEIDGANAGSFDTQRQNLVESTAVKFNTEGSVQGNHSMAIGDVFSITITYDGGETFPDDSKHAEIVFGSTDYPANVSFEMCSIYFEHESYEINDADDEEYPNSIVWNVNLHRSFDETDIISLSSSVHGPVDGTSIGLELVHVDDSSDIQMIWNYGDDNAWSGKYVFNVSVIDYNGNSWSINRKFDLVIVGSPDIDFILGDITIEEPVYVGQPVSINATVEAVGDPSLRGLRPMAYIQIINSSGEIAYEDYNTMSIDTYDVKSVSFFWVVDQEDIYTVKIWIDYLEGEEDGTYLENNDQGNGEDNNYAESSFQSKKAEKTDSDDEEWYEDSEVQTYGGGGIAALLVILLVIFVIRRRGSDEDDEDFEDDYDEDEDEIYEF